MHVIVCVRFKRFESQLAFVASMIASPEKWSYHHGEYTEGGAQQPSKRQKIERSRGIDRPANLVVHEFQPHSSGKDGPTTFAERCFWARRCWCCLEPWQRDLLVENLKKLFGSSHFSGMAGYEMIIEEILVEVRHQTGLALPNTRSAHACDLEFSRQQVLVSLPECCRPHHIHTDIVERLPKDVRDNIENKLPADGLNIDIRRFAYKEIDDIIGEYYQNMRIGNDFAPCVLHPLKVQSGGCRCFHDPDFEAKLMIVDDTQDSKEIRAGLGGQDKPFRVHAAGVPCKDVSSFGKGFGRRWAMHGGTVSMAT